MRQSGRLENSWGDYRPSLRGLNPFCRPTESPATRSVCDWSVSNWLNSNPDKTCQVNPPYAGYDCDTFYYILFLLEFLRS